MIHPGAKFFRKQVTFVIPGIVLLILIFAGHAAAQHYNFKNYTLDNGLAQSQVVCSLQDSNGFLWLGTYGGGVSRFDGNKFENFTTRDGLSDNVVNDIIEDQDGIIWFGTDSGLNRYDGHSFSTYSGEKELPAISVWRVLEARDGTLWIGTFNKGVFHIDGKHFTQITKENGLPHDQVWSLFQDPDGNIWFGTPSGLAIYNGKTFIHPPWKKTVEKERINFMMQDWSNRTWLATNNGVYRIEGNNITHFDEKDGLLDKQVTSILQDTNGRFWFGTTKGLSYYDGKNFSAYTSKRGLVQDYVRSLLQDTEGNIWIGTDAGISQFRGKMFTYVGTEDGLKNNTVWAFHQEKENEVWISTEKGVSLFDKNKKTLTHLDNPLMKGYVYPLLKDKHGNLWFGDTKNLYKYDGKKYHDINKKLNIKLKNNRINVYCIFEDKDGIIWVGSELHGLLRLDGRKVKQFTVKDGLSDNGISTICQPQDGNLWLGTNNGISIYTGKEFIKLGTDRKWLNSRYVNTILTDKKGNIWIATYGAGLIKHTPSGKIGEGQFQTITTADGLTDDEVLIMIFDDTGDLWFGTNKGLNRLDVKEFNRSGKKKIRHFGKADGFVGIECNQNAAFKDWEGKLWFGTIKGTICCDPMENDFNPVEPRIRFTGLKLFHQAADLSVYSGSPGKTARAANSLLPPNLRLPHTQNHLTFEYVAISLTAPENVRYRIKLEGFDKQWSSVRSSTYYTYSNLSPGDYAFMVKACNSSGVWNKIPRVYRFTILTPFWNTWWFYSFIALLIFFSGFGFYKFRVRSLKKRQHKLEDKIRQHTLALKEEKQKVEEINLQLEQRVIERTRKLAAANRKLIRAQKLEAIGTLAGGVAHDLNNVLAGLVSYPELLLMRMDGEDPHKKYVQTIKKSGEKAAAIVQDLLSLARRSISVSDIINLNHVIDEFLESPEYEKILSYHPQVRLETDLDPELPNMSGSPVHISKALMNLISNAAEAMRAQGTITVHTYMTALDSPPEGYDEVNPGEYAVLEVADTGIGIAPTDIDHIFEPFFTKKKLGRSGTGLGMAVVWGTVEDHKGYITVKSTQGEGTRFFLYFPASHEELSIHADHYFSFDDLKGQGQSILVVDDVVEQKEAAALMLEQLGYTVHAVSSGEEAVEYVKKQPVDLLVLDMIMDPGINGLETFKQIIKLYPHQKALIVSGYSETRDAKEVEHLAHGRFLKKPFGLQQIGNAVKECFENDETGKPHEPGNTTPGHNGNYRDNGDNKENGDNNDK